MRAPTARRKSSGRAAAAPLRLDLGCGDRKRDGFVGVDVWAGPDVDVVCDLERYPWPWEDDSVDEIFCSHYAEHVREFSPFMDEVYRVLKVGATATIVGPYYTSMRSFQDPTHHSALSEARFLYYNRRWREQNRLSHYPIRADFDAAFGHVWTPDWEGRSQEARDFALRHYWNVVADLQVVLTKRPAEGQQGG
jgi:SAM-dependent methyltransferase